MTQTADTDLDPDVAEYLDHKASLELLVLIGTETTQRHSEVRDELLVSSSTLLKRLKTGVRVGLFERELELRDGVNAKVYRLTAEGEAIFERAKDEGLPYAYQLRREFAHTLERKKRHIIDPLSEP